MKQYPLVVGSRAVRKNADHAVQRPERDARGPWITFHYSSTEISASGTTARVRAKRASYQNGRLAAESFEGELDRDCAERLLVEAQRRFSDQAALFVRSLFGWPKPPR